MIKHIRLFNMNMELKYPSFGWFLPYPFIAGGPSAFSGHLPAIYGPQCPAQQLTNIALVVLTYSIGLCGLKQSFVLYRRKHLYAQK